MSSSDVFTPIFFLFDELGVGKLGRGVRALVGTG